jgi:elongation factor 2
MSKSPNKHNRIHAKAVALEEGFAEAVEDNKVGPKDDPKVRAKYLNDEFGWDKEHAGLKLWNFGPENAGPNTLVDATKGV